MNESGGEMTIKIKPSPEMQLLMFTGQHVCRRDQVDPQTIRVWLSNGYGLTVKEVDNTGSVNLTAVKYGHLQMVETADRWDYGLRDYVGTERILEALMFLNTLPSVIERDHRLNTLGQIIERSRRDHDRLFSPETIKLTKQTQARMVYPSFSPDGAYLITGEIIAPGSRRRYTVRRAWFGETGTDRHSTEPWQQLRTEISGSFMSFERVNEAVAYASDRAKIARSRWKFVPDPWQARPFDNYSSEAF